MVSMAAEIECLPITLSDSKFNNFVYKSTCMMKVLQNLSFKQCELYYMHDSNSLHNKQGLNTQLQAFSLHVFCNVSHFELSLAWLT